MADPDLRDDPGRDGDEGPIVLRRPLRDSGDLDITPMIDITFLLLIFFLVASVPDYQKAVRLPGARHGKGVSEQNSVIVSVFERGGKGPAEVYLGDGRSGQRLPDTPKAQEERITQAVEQGLAAGKPTVLIKAERDVKHREVSRVAAAAGRVENIKLHLAVMEID